MVVGWWRPTGYGVHRGRSRGAGGGVGGVGGAARQPGLEAHGARVGWGV